MNAVLTKVSLADRLISFLPLLISLLIIAQYLLVPNFRDFTPLDQNVPTHTFTWFMGIIAALFFIWSAAAFKVKPLYTRLRRTAPLLSVALLLLLAYDWASLKSGTLPQPFFPWPDAILNAALDDRALLWLSTYHSLTLLFTGYFIGAALGVASGVAAGWSPTVRYWIQPLVKLMGSIPAITWLPLVLIVATSLFGGSVFLIALGVWVPVTMTTMNGVLNIPKGIFEAASTFGASKICMLVGVAIPASSPFIFQGLTQGMAIACTALLVAEMMGVEAGLGWYITWQRGWAEFDNMYAAIIIICLTFLAVNTVLNYSKNRALRWKEWSS